MAVPWLRLIDTAIGLGDVVRRVRGRQTPADDLGTRAIPSSAIGGIEARLAGVVVAALREAFDRDHQRLELERTQMEAERQRQEKLLRLERLRQAGDREIARMRLIAGIALASWFATLVLAARVLEGIAGRVMLALGWLLLLTALASAFSEQTRLTRALADADERSSLDTITATSVAGAAAPWFVVAGLAAVAIALLLS